MSTFADSSTTLHVACPNCGSSGKLRVSLKSPGLAYAECVKCGMVLSSSEATEMADKWAKFSEWLEAAP